MWDGQPVGGSIARPLDQFDVFVRWNQAVPIVEKVLSRSEPSLTARVSSQKPFGLRTFFHGAPTPTGIKDPIKLYGSQKVSWIDRSGVPQNVGWVD